MTAGKDCEELQEVFLLSTSPFPLVDLATTRFQLFIIQYIA